MLMSILFRRIYKERLGVPPKVIIGYQSHADTATKSGSSTKNKFVAWGPSVGILSALRCFLSAVFLFTFYEYNWHQQTFEVEIEFT